MGRCSKFHFVEKPPLRLENWKIHSPVFLSFSRPQEGVSMKSFVILAVFMATALVADGACPAENGVPLQSFSFDGCNSCRCLNNMAACTLMACGTQTDLLGAVHPYCNQDYWPDPCNFCKCNDGNAECTYASCPTSWYD